MRVLAVDVGGNHVKALLEGEPRRRRYRTPKRLSAKTMVEKTLKLVDGWEFDRVSVGVPAQVVDGRVVHEPVNLGDGWVGFDFEAAFGVPTKVVNDAVMQAVGSYEGGRMLFLGLGTGLGSAMIVDGVIEPMELGHMPYRKATYEDYVGRAGRRRLGQKRWRKAVLETIELLSEALEPGTVVLGGGLADEVGTVPANVRIGGNKLAFVGGFRLWTEKLESRDGIVQAEA
jgi:predicted NBD/HSP70 family sugar kinase